LGPEIVREIVTCDNGIKESVGECRGKTALLRIGGVCEVLVVRGFLEQIIIERNVDSVLNGGEV
jgi:hypothetical protein